MTASGVRLGLNQLRASGVVPDEFRANRETIMECEASLGISISQWIPPDESSRMNTLAGVPLVCDCGIPTGSIRAFLGGQQVAVIPDPHLQQQCDEYRQRIGD